MPSQTVGFTQLHPPRVASVRRRRGRRGRSGEKSACIWQMGVTTPIEMLTSSINAHCISALFSARSDTNDLDLLNQFIRDLTKIEFWLDDWEERGRGDRGSTVERHPIHNGTTNGVRLGGSRRRELGPILGKKSSGGCWLVVRQHALIRARQG